LKRVLERYRDVRIKVAYEAGPFGFWLLDRLVQDGIETIVVPPSLIPVESGNKVKTDKRDSRKLATLLEKNMLKRVYVLTREEREHRDLLRTRRQIVDHRNNVARQIKSKLMFYGISSPFTSTTRWSVQYVEWLKTITFETTYLKEAFDLLIELYEYLTLKIARINRTVVLLCRDKNYRQKIKLPVYCTGYREADGHRAPRGAAGHNKVQERGGACIVHRAHPCGILDRRTDTPGQDHQVRQ